MNPLEIEIQFKKDFGMTLAQAFKNLEKFKSDNEERYQEAISRAANDSTVK